MAADVTSGDYGALYTDARVAQTRASAAAVVPIVLELLPVRSVVDVGCGVGTWLGEFERRGVADHVGIDAEWVSLEQLEIARDRFVEARLERPLHLDRTFDLALSLEVAEHLPEYAADTLVQSVTDLAPVVVFSAAVPGQGGIGHVNEQWPAYWARRFASRGYAAVDAIRPRIWRDDAVAYWYRQNILVFARSEAVDASAGLARAAAATEPAMLDLVHPDLLTHVTAAPDAHARRVTARELTLRELADGLAHAVPRSIRWRLRGVAAPANER